MPDDATPPSPAMRIVTMEMDAEDDAFLEGVTRNMGVPKAELLREAPRDHAAGQRRDMELIRKGLRDIEAGRTVSHEDIAAWIDSLGTEHEMPRPERGCAGRPRLRATPTRCFASFPATTRRRRASSSGACGPLREH